MSVSTTILWLFSGPSLLERVCSNAERVFFVKLTFTQGTLLNRLFGTNFDVMDESKRQQTTKGVLIDFAVRVDPNYTRRDLDVPRKEYECNGYGCRGNGWTRTWRGSSTHVMASDFL